MPALENAKHELFAQAIAKGATGREAYRAAGYAVKTDGAADANASRLLGTAKVASRVRELQSAAAEEAVVTAADLSAQLEVIRSKAIGANQFGAAAQAVMGRAKLHGLIIDKAEVKATIQDLSDDDLEARIRQKMDALGLAR